MDRILIIDDSELELRMLGDILKERYEVITAKSGWEGVLLAQRMKPSLILLDIVMPRTDGFEILDQLKNEEETANIPVIFLTGLTDENMEEKGLLKGAVDYIKKPYNHNIVRARVRTQVNAYRYWKTIETQMAMDSITGVNNRNDYERRKKEIWYQVVCDEKNVSVVMIDIDYFKKINDTYGHSEGDYVLRSVAEEIKKSFESDGYVARYGGEEFVVILPGMSKEETMDRARQFCHHVRELKIPNPQSDICPYLTVSVGGSMFCARKSRQLAKESQTPHPVQPSSAELHSMEQYSIEQLVREADASLYEAKRSGRNQVRWKE